MWWWDSDSPTYGPTASGLAAVTRATSLIVNSICAAPWRYFSGSPDPRLAMMEMPAPRWLLDPALSRPDERFGASPVAAAMRLPRAAFWSQWMRSCLLKGMGYLVFEEGPEGEPIAGTLRILNPDYISPETEPFIHRRIGSTTGDLWVETDWDGRFTLGPRTYRLVELNNPLAQVDDFGMTEGVLTMHARELGLASQAADYGSGMMRSGVPAGFLKVGTSTFTKAQANQLRADWLLHHGGDRRSIAVLNAAVDFEPIQMSPIDLALIETRKMSLVDIANAFGVPVYMLGGGEPGGMTYSNAESRSLDFRTFTLLPWANAAEDVLSALLPQQKWVEVDFRGLLRSDTKTRYDAYAVALAAGFFSVDEVRRLEGLPPLPESVAPNVNLNPPVVGEPAINPEPLAPEEVPA